MLILDPSKQKKSLQTTISTLMKMVGRSSNGYKTLWVQNAVGKGEIARFEQFLLFPQCFQKTYTANM